MSDFPHDIFTEPENVDPDTLANLGPLSRLAGIWEGKKGVDLNPKAEGPERREFTERIEFHPIDPQANGPQLFYGLRYHTRILATDEDATFHDQVGYWLWEPATGLVMQTLAIPRGQIAMAAGHAAPDATSLVLTARRGDPEYGICSTAFLEYAFRTDSYRIEVTFNPDGGWSYVLDTMLSVRGRTEPFTHRDVNTLSKVAEPAPNPLMLLDKR
jgi:hypothetical protein